MTKMVVPITKGNKGNALLTRSFWGYINVGDGCWWRIVDNGFW